VPKDETYTLGSRTEYILDQAPKAASHPMTLGEAQALQEALRNPGVLLVREVTYGPWLPWGSNGATLACSNQHNSMNACPRCGFDPLTRHQPEPEPEPEPRPRTLQERLDFEADWDRRVEEGWAKNGRPPPPPSRGGTPRPSIIGSRK
jgi:hypothetical protein